MPDRNRLERPVRPAGCHDPLLGARHPDELSASRAEQRAYLPGNRLEDLGGRRFPRDQRGNATQRRVLTHELFERRVGIGRPHVLTVARSARVDAGAPVGVRGTRCTSNPVTAKVRDCRAFLPSAASRALRGRPGINLVKRGRGFESLRRLGSLRAHNPKVAGSNPAPATPESRSQSGFLRFAPQVASRPLYHGGTRVHLASTSRPVAEPPMVDRLPAGVRVLKRGDPRAQVRGHSASYVERYRGVRGSNPDSAFTRKEHFRRAWTDRPGEPGPRRSDSRSGTRPSSRALMHRRCKRERALWAPVCVSCYRAMSSRGLTVAARSILRRAQPAATRYRAVRGAERFPAASVALMRAR